MASRRRILVLLPNFLPGEKAGGPVQSVSALAEELGDEFDFRIATSDRDLGDREAYPGLQPGVWTPVNGTPVLYLPREGFGARLRELLADSWHDVLYLNSAFSRRFSMAPLALVRLGVVRRVPVVVAPRGELNRGALALKGVRKRAYLRLARALGITRDVTWHASTDAEAEEIRRWLGSSSPIGVALPFGRRAEAAVAPVRPPKRPGRLSAIFASRISRKKNLDGALRALAGVAGDVELTIHGPREDDAYARECEALVRLLPPNVRVRDGGLLPHAAVADAFSRHDLFLFPTRGENFGQVVLEALSAGCPAVLGADTPWRGLEDAGGGWVVDPLDESRLRSAIQQCVEAGPEEWEDRSRHAKAFAQRTASRAAAIEAHRHVFRAVGLSSGRTVSSRRAAGESASSTTGRRADEGS